MDINFAEQWEQAKGQILLQAAQLEQRCLAAGMNAAEARKVSEEIVALHQQYQSAMVVSHLQGQLLQARLAGESAAKIAMVYGAKGHAKECEGISKVAELQQLTAADLQTEVTRLASGMVTFDQMMREDIEAATAASSR
jgi:hypothetical protein